jgi:DNA-binding MarR family transcriptional regulator
MTALIDRLERAGYVRREWGMRDRRQALVVPEQEKIDKELAPVTQSTGAAV